MLVGLSFSFCIKDIIQDKVNPYDVERIIAATHIQNDYDLDEVITRYRASYWKDNPDVAEKLARKFWALGMIQQPRLTEDDPPSIASGHWYKYTTRSPHDKDEIVEANWEYAYDRAFQDGYYFNDRDGEDREHSNSIIVHNPEWVGKKCGECSSWKYFLVPKPLLEAEIYVPKPRYCFTSLINRINKTTQSYRERKNILKS